MWKDKSPGVKILWIWTIGTAAVLVASVATTRMRDLQQQLKVEETPLPPPQESEAVILDNSTEFVQQDKF